MKVAILAGGKGTRLGPYSQHRPKPMVEIGGSPILLHIMEHYLSFGHGSFVIAIGHRGEVIERWFHHGFWQCMDTAHEKTLLDNMWQSGKAPWLERHVSGATVNGWGVR